MVSITLAGARRDSFAFYLPSFLPSLTLYFLFLWRPAQCSDALFFRLISSPPLVRAAFVAFVNSFSLSLNMMRTGNSRAIGSGGVDPLRVRRLIWILFAICKAVIFKFTHIFCSSTSAHPTNMDRRGAEAAVAAAVMAAPYIGHLVDRRYHGFGRTLSLAGDEYCGEFVQGRRDGKGIMVWGAAEGAATVTAPPVSHGGGGSKEAAAVLDPAIYGTVVVGGEPNNSSNNNISSSLKSSEKSPAETVRYIGDWTHNDATGLGVLLLPRDTAYYGDVVHATRNGEGLLVGASGATRYAGEWENGKRHGFGVQQGPDGVYAGEWDRGTRSGWGCMQFASGNLYFGEWYDNTMEGYGSMTWFRSSIHASAATAAASALSSSSGAVGTGGGGGAVAAGGISRGALPPTGPTAASEPADVIERYEGEFANGRPDGEGDFYLAFTSATGFETLNHFRGQFLEGTRHGKGIQVFADGTAYEGDWVRNAKHGRGTVYHPDGSFDPVTMENDTATSSLDPMRGSLTGEAVLKIQDILSGAAPSTAEPHAPPPLVTSGSASLIGSGRKLPTATAIAAGGRSRPSTSQVATAQPSTPAVVPAVPELPPPPPRSELRDVAEIASRYASVLRHLFSLYSAMDVPEDPSEGLRRMAQPSTMPLPKFASRIPPEQAPPIGLSELERNIAYLQKMTRWMVDAVAKKSRRACDAARQTILEVQEFFQRALDEQQQLQLGGGGGNGSSDDGVWHHAVHFGAPGGVVIGTDEEIFLTNSKKLFDRDVGSPSAAFSNGASPRSSSLHATATASSTQHLFSSPIRGLFGSAGGASSSSSNSQGGASSSPRRNGEVLDASLPLMGVPFLPKTRKPTITPMALYAMLCDCPLPIISSHFSREHFDTAIATVLQRASSPGHLTLAERSLTYNGFVEALVRVAHARFAMSFPYFYTNHLPDATLSVRFQHLIEEHLLPLTTAARELDMSADFVALHGSRRGPKEAPTNITLDELRKSAIKQLRDRGRMKAGGGGGVEGEDRAAPMTERR